MSRQFTRDFLLEVAKGNIPGHSIVRKFGHNINVGTSLETIWGEGGIYAYPASATTMTTSSSDVDDQGNVVSSGTATGGSTTTLIDSGATFVSDGVAAGDALLNDTNNQHGIILTIDSEIQVTVLLPMADGDMNVDSAANASSDAYRIVNANDTGVAVVKIVGQDSNRDNQSEYIVMNGQTGVTSDNSYLRMYRIFSIIAGSSGFNEGVIYVGTGAITAGKPANVYSSVEAELSQTLQCLYSIPRGKTGFFVGGFVTVGTGKEVDCRSVIRPRGEVFNTKAIFHVAESPFALSAPAPIILREQTDIEVRGVAIASSTPVSASMTILLIDN